VIGGALGDGGSVTAVALYGFDGLVGREIQPDRRLGTELSDHAKRNGAGGIFHTDELPAYGVTEAEVADLREPIRGGQDTPKHVFKWLTEDVFMFLHLDNPDVTQAERVDYFGVAVRGEFSEASQPHSDFTHFHKWTSASWEGGHGGGAGAYGYWFLHNAVTPHEEPWGMVQPGPDLDFMPTPPSSC
jgi:hypothetical protein